MDNKKHNYVTRKDNVIQITNIEGKTVDIVLNLNSFSWKIGIYHNYALLNFHSFFTCLESYAVVDKSITNEHSFFIRRNSVLKFNKSISKRMASCYHEIIKEYVPEDLLLLHKTAFNKIGPKQYKTIAYIINELWFEKRESLNYLIRDIKNGYNFAVIYFIYKFYYYHKLNKSVSEISPENWMSFFKDSSNKLLKNWIKTLMILKKYPLNIIYDILTIKPQKQDLPKVFTDSLVFNGFLMNETQSYYCSRLHVIKNILVNSTKKDWLMARQKLSKQLRRKIDFRKLSELRFMTKYIRDSITDNYTTPKNIHSAIKKAIDWHVQIAIETKNKLLKEAEQNKLKMTQKPAILPKSPNIKFLSTVQDIIEEGVNMNHCVGSYSSRAMNGNCYLFHINYKGEVATAELSPDFKIVQIHGPNNSNNKACSYGKRYLNTFYNKTKKQNLVLTNEIKNDTLNNNLVDIPF